MNEFEENYSIIVNKPTTKTYVNVSQCNTISDIVNIIGGNITCNQLKIIVQSILTDYSTYIHSRYQTISVPVPLSKSKKKELLSFLDSFLKHKRASSIIRIWFRKKNKKWFDNEIRIINKNKINCINASDFYTLDPIEDIPYHRLYILYENGFSYACSIDSLRKLIIQTANVNNPYTRTAISKNEIAMIRRILCWSNYFYPVNNNIKPVITNTTILHVPQNTTFLKKSLYLSQSEIHRPEGLLQIRNLSQKNRIEQIFIEIDRLGDYTQSDWFHRLYSKYQYIGFLQTIRSKWEKLEVLQRHSVCPHLHGDPFYHIPIHSLQQFSISELYEMCIIVMENLLFSTINNDNYKKTSAIYIMIALGTVSDDIAPYIPYLER